MNTELFIASRIIKGKSQKGRFSRPIIRISVAGIALGLCAMILSVAVVNGFKEEIRGKISGFDAHVRISNFDNNNSFEFTPVKKDQPFVNKIKNNADIKSISSFALKAGIIKANKEIHGVVVKGVDENYDWDFFKNNLLEGSVLNLLDSVKSNEILISGWIAKTLKLKLNDSVPVFFIQNNNRLARKFRICGIYETGLGAQFDEFFILADIKHIQKLNKWDSSQVAGFDVVVNDFNKLDELTEWIGAEVGYELQAVNLKDRNRQLFSWLNAQDVNAVVVIVLMVVVACINMIATLLILILEKTNMIGIMKSLGASDWSIRKIFLYNALYLVGKGLLWGNIIALLLAFLQWKFGLVKLNAEQYLLSEIPIYLNGIEVLILNLGTFVVCLIMMLIPSYLVSKIKPIKAIRFN